VPVALKMPKLGQDMTEGTVIEWAKRVGDEVRAGDVLVHIETNKAEVEYESPVSGHLRAILVEEGETVPVGTRIAWIAGSTDEPLPASEPLPAEKPAPEQAPAPMPASSQPVKTPVRSTPDPSGRVPASPRARAAARRLGVDLAAVIPTGPHGWVTHEDVEQAAKELPDGDR
jgi:pyruvate dehydrogenase E2 component (dihydrolipoyllysine-residue acetyltransferase)